MKTIPFAAQQIEQDDIDAVVAVLHSDWLTNGPTVRQFEEAFAARVGAKFAVAFSSGTTALHAVYDSIETAEGIDTIVPACTFTATVGPVLRGVGAPLFTDIDRKTWCMDPRSLASLLDSSTTAKLVVPVHFLGLPAPMKEIAALAEEHDLVVVEDACQALGATYESQPIGNCHYSKACVFSFHPAKQITSAEGGMVTTNDEQLYMRLKLFRDHGRSHLAPPPTMADNPNAYDVVLPGMNYRMSEVHAALGLSQLRKLDRFIEKRKALVRRYRTLLEGKPFIQLQDQPEGREASPCMMIVLIDFAEVGVSRPAVMEKLKAHGISSGVHYFPVNRFRIFRELYPDQADACPIAMEYYRRCLTLPLHTGMSEADVDFVVEKLLEAIS